MDTKFQSEYIPYSQTGKFTKIVLDYVTGEPALKDFYGNSVSVEGVKSVIAERKKFKTDRKLLVEQFSEQYGEQLENSGRVKANIEALSNEDTFTICTAHQPNIFTGHLYFVYKILHIIKLSDFLKKELPEYNFVPVFFMGSEDADVEELNHIELDGEKYVWETNQTGAFGRMKVDDAILLKLIGKISGRLSVERYGSILIGLLKKCYVKNVTIEQATFLFVHELFREFGLLILLPDNPAFKKEMASIFEEDIFNHTSSEIVKTSEKLSAHYKAQAYPREINLFYLKDNLRNRIVPVGMIIS